MDIGEIAFWSMLDGKIRMVEGRGLDVRLDGSEPMEISKGSRWMYLKGKEHGGGLGVIN